MLYSVRERVLKASEQLQKLVKLRKAPDLPRHFDKQVEAGKSQREWERQAMGVLVAWAFPELLAEVGKGSFRDYIHVCI